MLTGMLCILVLLVFSEHQLTLYSFHPIGGIIGLEEGRSCFRIGQLTGNGSIDSAICQRQADLCRMHQAIHRYRGGRIYQEQVALCGGKRVTIGIAGDLGIALHRYCLGVFLHQSHSTIIAGNGTVAGDLHILQGQCTGRIDHACSCRIVAGHQGVLDGDLCAIVAVDHSSSARCVIVLKQRTLNMGSIVNTSQIDHSAVAIGAVTNKLATVNIQFGLTLDSQSTAGTISPVFRKNTVIDIDRAAGGAAIGHNTGSGCAGELTGLVAIALAGGSTVSDGNAACALQIVEPVAGRIISTCAGHGLAVQT